MGGGGDGAGAAHEHDREEVGVVAAEHREVGGGSGQQAEGVGVDAPHRLLDAHDVVGRGQLEKGRRAEPRSRPVGDVVDHDRHRRAGRHRLEVGHDPGL